MPQACPVDYYAYRRDARRETPRGKPVASRRLRRLCLGIGEREAPRRKAVASILIVFSLRVVFIRCLNARALLLIAFQLVLVPWVSELIGQSVCIVIRSCDDGWLVCIRFASPGMLWCVRRVLNAGAAFHACRHCVRLWKRCLTGERLPIQCSRTLG